MALAERDGERDVTRDGPGAVEAATVALLGELKYGDGDPRAVIGTVALQLARALDEQPANPNLARELRAHVQWIAEFPNEDAGAVDEIRARRAVRRIGFLLDAAGEAS